MFLRARRRAAQRFAHQQSSPSHYAFTRSASPTEEVVCEDTTDLVPVSSRHGNRTCAWIGGHMSWKTYLCREGYEAFEQCQETCNSCDSQVTNPEPNDSCEDSKKMFYVDKRLGHMRCYFFGQFLSRNPQLKPKFCAPDQNAYDECPDTCGKCTDSCEDQPDKYFLRESTTRIQRLCMVGEAALVASQIVLRRSRRLQVLQ